MRVLAAVIALVVWSAAAAAQDFKAGLDAYDRGDFAAAMAQWQPLAEQGDVRAQFNLGVIHYNAQGVPFDPKTAAHWYREAADQGYGPAQANLALLYDVGEGVLQNYVEALKWAILAQNGGVADAAATYEKLTAKMTPEQIAEAKRAAADWRISHTNAAPPKTSTSAPPAAPTAAAASTGAAPAAPVATTAEAEARPVTREQIVEVQRHLNALGFDAGAPDGVAGPRTTAALRDYQEKNGLAATGVITAGLVNRLASAASGGAATEPVTPAPSAPPSTPDRPDKAPASAPGAEAPAAAATAPPPDALDCDRLAGHPADPSLPAGVSGVAFADIDADRAIVACEKAVHADRTNARYQFELGRSEHKAGRMADAVAYYQQAALRGHTLAQKSLGFAYANGLGVSQDFAKAAQWHHIAAEQGDIDAQRNLGYLYASGHGVDEDYVQAYMWYSIAATRGSADAEEQRKRMAGRMTNRQIAEAERRAAAWFDLHPNMRPPH